MRHTLGIGTVGMRANAMSKQILTGDLPKAYAAVDIMPNVVHGLAMANAMASVTTWMKFPTGGAR